MLDRTPKRILRAVRRSVVRQRHRGLHPADVLVAVYPKSGSTWVRFLMTHAVTGEAVSWDTLRSVSPPVGEHRRGPGILAEGGRLIKTHEPRAAVSGTRPPRVMHVVRDGRDVAVSYYFQLCRQGWFSGGFDEFLSPFLKGELDNFGPWHEHVLSWTKYRQAHEESAVVVRYEDLLERPVAVLCQAMGHLGTKVTADAMQAAVDAHSVAEMRRQEKKAKIVQSTVANSDIPFVRSAKSGGWREMFDATTLERFNQSAGDALVAAGYPVLTSTE